MMFNKVYNSIGSALFEYNTSKLVRIKNKKVGFLFRFIQLLIISYIVGYVIIYKKGYQKHDVGLSTVTTKVKGIAHTNLSLRVPVGDNNGKFTFRVKNFGYRTWDSADYVTPAEEYDAVFVMTNAILTPNQRQKTCPEADVPAARCTTDSNCTAGKIPKNGHGVMTGKCVKADRPVSSNYLKMCEIHAWCPVENNKLPMDGWNFGQKLTNKTVLLNDSINFTILIKNTVRFPGFGDAVVVRNINDAHNNEEYLKNCEYNKDDDEMRLCPIIRLKTIFKEIRDTNFNDTAFKGGVVGIKIAWDCNLDYDIKECLPRYSFFRLDNANAKIAAGYNVRIPQYDKGMDSRTLIKAYGIRFVIMVDAQAGKFNIVPLLRNFGAGLGLLAVATVLGDICVLYLLKQRTYYRNQKFLYADKEQDGNEGSIQVEGATPNYIMFNN